MDPSKVRSTLDTDPHRDSAASSAPPVASREQAGRGWKQAILREVRSHPFGYSVLGVALVLGPVLIAMIFPQVTPVQAIVGGLAFGVYAALCAVPQKFM